MFCAQRGLRPWSQTMVSEGARPWGRGSSGDCEFLFSFYLVLSTFLALPKLAETIFNVEKFALQLGEEHSQRLCDGLIRGLQRGC